MESKQRGRRPEPDSEHLRSRPGWEGEEMVCMGSVKGGGSSDRSQTNQRRPVPDDGGACHNGPYDIHQRLMALVAP